MKMVKDLKKGTTAKLNDVIDKMVIFGENILVK